MSMITRRSSWQLGVAAVLCGCLVQTQPGTANAQDYGESAPARKAAPAPKAAAAKAAPGAKGAPAPAAKAAPAAKPQPPDPARERATKLRDAAGKLDKAAEQLAAGNRSYAEELFSTAELLVGPEALADLAPRFRAGAPPRVNTPLVTVPDQGKQPAVAGSSDEDDPDPRPLKGALAGNVQIDGKAGGGIGVVTLEPIGKKAKKRTAKQRVVEQRDRQFLPRVMAVPVGSTVSFPNYDATFHNVFSSSDSKSFDLGLYKSGQAREVTFDKEGVIRLGCNLHANMSAFVIVVAAPHYAITDDEGNFKFGSLAPGKYRLKAWNEKSLEPVTQDIVIKAGTNQVTVGVKGDAPAGPPPDKFGVPRGGKK